MSLIEFNPGEVALSSAVNNNFNYLNSLITDLGSTITSSTSSFSAQVANLNTSVQNLISYRDFFLVTGMILPFIGEYAPTGFLECDGSEVSIEDFEDLYDVIGDTFGSPSNSTFNLPDLRNRTLWGAGNINIGTCLESQLPNITGQFRLAGTEGATALSGAFSSGTKGGSYATGHEPGAKNPLIKFSASDSCSVYSDNCSIVQPPAMCISFIIKY